MNIYFIFSSFFIQAWFEREIFQLLHFADIPNFFEVQKVEHFRGNIFADQIKTQSLHIVDEFIDIIKSRFNFRNF